jgi:signal transduction histidine kinase/CheY-like chemotaxis protein
MQGSHADINPLSADVSRRALECVHGWLREPSPDPRDLGRLLAELAGAFEAPAAGLSCLRDGSPLLRHPAAGRDGRPAPWQQESDILSRARSAASAVTVERPGGGSFLLTTLGWPGYNGWLLWLEDERRAEWADAEAAAFALAGQALTRWLHASAPAARWADQLERAARQQRLETAADLARRLAHDFGNVLTGILGFTELALTQQVHADSPLHTYLLEVQRSAQSGAQMTHLLRQFSRRQAPAGRSCLLHPVLTAEEARLRALPPPAPSLHLSLPADLPPLALDADHLRQVLAALLDNAREALVGAGAISVSARTVELSEADCRDLFGDVRPGPHVEVTVADTGAGLSPDAQRRLFAEPFFSTKPRRRGFGLATAYGILHAHRGGLRLLPGSERGAVARVLLPLAPVVAPSQVAAAAEPARGERVLVVDDDAMILQLVSTTLERAGYRVQAVGGGEEALKAYAAAGRDPFRLVLTDVLMPRLGGLELARRLLGRDAGARVLFMSGQVSADFSPADFAGHGFELLHKPFRPEGLLRAVRHALDRPAPRRAPGRAAGEEPVVSSTS